MSVLQVHKPYKDILSYILLTKLLKKHKLAGCKRPLNQPTSIKIVRRDCQDGDDSKVESPNINRVGIIRRSKLSHFCEEHFDRSLHKIHQIVSKALHMLANKYRC